MWCNRYSRITVSIHTVEISRKPHPPSSVPILVNFPPTTPHIRPHYSSFSDLSSVQLLLPIIPDQQSRVRFFIRFYIYWLFCHSPSGYPISDQVSHPASSSHITPIRRPHSSSSTDPVSDHIEVHLVSPPSTGYISQFLLSIKQFQ